MRAHGSRELGVGRLGLCFAAAAALPRAFLSRLLTVSEGSAPLEIQWSARSSFTVELSVFFFGS